MYKHAIVEPLAEGKKVRRAGWPAKDVVVSGKSLGQFELDEDEAKKLGVKPGTLASVSSEALVYVDADGNVTIGYTPTPDDAQCADWEVVK